MSHRPRDLEAVFLGYDPIDPLADAGDLHERLSLTFVKLTCVIGVVVVVSFLLPFVTGVLQMIVLSGLCLLCLLVVLFVIQFSLTAIRLNRLLNQIKRDRS